MMKKRQKIIEHSRSATAEDFLWDGLALIKRGDERFVNEPHIGGGNPVASSKGTKYFNDALGTTVGAKTDRKVLGTDPEASKFDASIALRTEAFAEFKIASL